MTNRPIRVTPEAYPAYTLDVNPPLWHEGIAPEESHQGELKRKLILTIIIQQDGNLTLFLWVNYDPSYLWGQPLCYCHN